MASMVENFAVVIQSGQHVILTNETVFRVWVFSPSAGGESPRCLDKDHQNKIMSDANNVLWMLNGICQAQFLWC